MLFNLDARQAELVIASITSISVCISENSAFVSGDEEKNYKKRYKKVKKGKKIIKKQNRTLDMEE